MYSKSSMANFVLSYYQTLNGDKKTRIISNIRNVMYYLLGSSYTFRTFLQIFCYETNFCHVSITGLGAHYIIPILFDNKSILIASVFAIYQIVFVMEYFVLNQF